MSSDTLRSRLSHLLTKSRKAAYLYQHTAQETQKGLEKEQDQRRSGRSGGKKLQGFAGQKPANEKKYSNLQVLVWQHVNESLSASLRKLLQTYSQRELSHQALKLRDSLYDAWRRVEGELHQEREALRMAVAEEHYVRSTILAEKLIVLKARVQATKAAFSEYEAVVVDLTRSDGASQGSLGFRQELTGLNYSESGSQDQPFRNLSTSEESDESQTDRNSKVLPFSVLKRRGFR